MAGYVPKIRDGYSPVFRARTISDRGSIDAENCHAIAAADGLIIAHISGQIAVFLRKWVIRPDDGAEVIACSGAALYSRRVKGMKRSMPPPISPAMTLGQLMRSRRPTITLLTRFATVGLANTVLGLAMIAVLDVGFHVRPALANAVAFAFGISISFFLTRSLVFRSQTAVGSRAGKYVLAMASAFMLNQLVLLSMGRVLGAGPAAHLAAQLMGMATYTIANFLLCRYWVFSEEGT